MTMNGEPAIRLDGLTKHFGDFVAVDTLTVEVAAGGVIGFLGPNGAGKSTTIRMLLGLIRPNSGEASVLGSSISSPADYMHKVGALIEAPAFYPKLSGYDNLRTLALLQGLPESRLDPVLEQVGLDGRERDQVGDYSLGMKQRLGIGAALLRDPDVLILDEPTNGLDPQGIVEIRGLLMRLGAEGKTILVSSHLLAEIQAACERLIIIKRGALVFEGLTDDLLAHTNDEVVAVPEHPADAERLANVLRSSGFDASVDGGSVRIPEEHHSTPKINRLAFDNDITLRQLRADVEDLEDVFLRMTSEERVA